MARMIRTIVSIPADEKTWLDGYGKRHRMSSAEAVRRAIREFRGRRATEMDSPLRAVEEGRAAYGSPASPDLVDAAELRRRAAEAAGRFASGVSDLAVSHDRYLAEDGAEEPTEKKPERGEPGPGRARKTRKSGEAP